MPHVHDHDHAAATMCHSCDCQPFLRNAYWTGKLMLARDFTDEQRYLVEKLRHHNQRLHGTGVVCGLKVVPHNDEECRKYFVCVEPGTAVDCCGHDIVLCERECIDLRTIPEIKKLFDDPNQTPHALRVCVRYRECPTEDIPVLYDECGCDDARCAPNRILESYELIIELLDKLPEPPKLKVPENCCDLWEHLDCHDCDGPDCVVLATISDFVAGKPIVDGAIDNLTFRKILPSVQAIKEFLDCLKLCEPGGGDEGPAGEGIDAVKADFIDCNLPGSAKIEVIGGVRTLVLKVPKGCDGADGAPGDAGDDGAPGDPGPGLELGLTQIKALSWTHNKPGSLATITLLTGEQHLGLVIEFTAAVQAATIDAAHIFQVLLARDEVFSDRLAPLRCRCAARGKVVPVKVTAGSGNVITAADETPDPKPRAVAFLFTDRENRVAPGDMLREVLRNQELWVLLRCDFVLDVNGKAVDGEHVRAMLPSGDRPAPPGPPSTFGIQGGLFESWFEVRQG